MLPFVARVTPLNPVQPSYGRQPAGPSASPGFGEHFVPRNYVVWIRSYSAKRSSITARWASPRGTDDGSATRLAQIISTRRRRSSAGSLRISAMSVSLHALRSSEYRVRSQYLQRPPRLPNELSSVIEQESKAASSNRFDHLLLSSARYLDVWQHVPNRMVKECASDTPVHVH